MGTLKAIRGVTLLGPITFLQENDLWYFYSSLNDAVTWTYVIFGMARTLYIAIKTWADWKLCKEWRRETPKFLDGTKFQILAYYAWPRTPSTKVTRKEKKSVTSARSPRNTSAQLRDR